MVCVTSQEHPRWGTPGPRTLLSLALASSLVLSAPAFADDIDPAEFSATLEVAESTSVTKTLTVTQGVDSALVDIVFLSDTTGSMGNLIDSVRSEVNSILDRAEALGDVQFGVAEYKDNSPLFDDPFVFRFNTQLTKNRGDVRDGVDEWDAELNSGGDFPEANFRGLQRVANRANWRNNSTRIIVWFGDAEGHERITTLEEAIEALVENAVIVEAIDVGTFGANINAFGQAQAIANATGGSFFDLDGGSVGQADIVQVIVDALEAAFAEYTSVEFEARGNGSAVDVDLCEPIVQEDPPFDRSIDREFQCEVTFTGREVGTHSFEVLAKIDGGIVARESDTITITGDGPPPPPPPPPPSEEDGLECELTRDEEDFSLIRGGCVTDAPGIGGVTIENGSNLGLETIGFEPGQDTLEFELRPTSPGLPASGDVIIGDLDENVQEFFVDIPVAVGGPDADSGWGEDAEPYLDDSDESPGRVAVAMGSGGLQIWNVSVFGEEQLEGTFTKRACGSREFYADDVEIVERTDGEERVRLAFIAAGACGLFIVDITQPQSIFKVGRLKTAGWAEDVTVVGNRAYVAAHDGGFLIADVSDPSSPEVLSRVGRNNPRFGSALDVVIRNDESGRIAFVGTSRGLFIIDVSRAKKPSLLGFKASRDEAKIVQDVAIDGGRAYVAWWRKGVAIFDVEDLSSPRKIGMLPLLPVSGGGEAVFEVHVANRTLYVAEGLSGLRSFDLGKRDIPEQQSSPVSLTVDGAYAWDVDTLPLDQAQDVVVAYGVVGDEPQGGFELFDYTEENRRDCGLGFEIALVLPLLTSLRRVFRRRAS